MIKEKEEKKTKGKKEMAHKGDTFAMPMMKPTPRRSVDIKKATNGFVVSSYQENGEKLFIAKTQEEAQKYANKLLKI